MIDYEIRCISKTDLDTTHGVLKAAEWKALSKSSKCILMDPLVIFLLHNGNCQNIFIRLSVGIR